jgi:hypothetical protein
VESLTGPNNYTLLPHLRLRSLFVASYDEQGLRWRYSNPPPHEYKNICGSGCVVPRFLYLGTSWMRVSSFTPRLLYPRGEGPRNPLDRSLGGPQSWSGWYREVEFRDPTRTRTPVPFVVQLLSRSYTDCATVAPCLVHRYNFFGTICYVRLQVRSLIKTKESVKDGKKTAIQNGTLSQPMRVNVTQRKTKLHGLSPRANYTDRATAACRRSDCQLFCG